MTKNHSCKNRSVLYQYNPYRSINHHREFGHVIFKCSHSEICILLKTTVMMPLKRYSDDVTKNYSDDATKKYSDDVTKKLQ